jgi:hypothetical protein
MWKPWFFVSLAAKYLKHKNYKWAKGVLFVEQRIFFFEIPRNIQLREKWIEAIYKVCGNYVVIYLTIKTLIRD